MKNCLALIICAFITVLSATVWAEPMTKEQGDAILEELREIKGLLAKQQQAQTAPAAAPQPENLAVNSDAIYVLGSSNAPLTLVEFTDYQCPFCARFESTTFPEIKKNYIDTGKVRLIVRDLPLEGLHPFALKAAQSVHCAGDQGKFWEMKDLVFKNQSKLDDASLAGYANQLQLNGNTFKSCMAEGKHLKEIADEAKYAQSLGITGTPTFVLGKIVGDSVQGRKIVGALPTEVFEGAINDMLGKSTD